MSFRRSRACAGKNCGPDSSGRGSRRRSLKRFLEQAADDHTAAIDQWPVSRLAAGVVLSSLLGLFLELAVIRWHSSCFHAFGHFKNVSLLSCFLGLGIGYAIGRRPRVWTPLLLPGLGLQVLLLESFSRICPDVALPASWISGLGLSIYQGQLLGEGISCLILLLVFVANAMVFIPLGQLASRLMGRMEKVRSYSYNLLGSVFGVLLFTAFSMLWLPPAIWMAAAAIAILPFLSRSRHALLLAGAGIGALLIGFELPDWVPQKRYFSPYQMLAVAPQPGGATTIHVGHAYHQRILDLGRSQIPDWSQGYGSPEMRQTLDEAADYYNAPYRLVARPADVLVVGSGTGNDVAAALRGGAGRVDAVEIDPAILWLGRTLHPERPYASSKVTPILCDARTHIRQTDRKYDLIVYGLLDSHSTLGSLSNVRLDSFVYTVEAFCEARRRLKPDGVLIMSFCLREDERGAKFYRMMDAAFGDGLGASHPRVFSYPYDVAKMFVAGPGAARLDFSVLTDELTDRYADPAVAVSLGTDDWPFVYLNVRSVPVRYLVIVALVLILSVAMIGRTVGFQRDSGSAVFFFLGAGFMLIETKGVTDLGLSFGNTWMTVAIVVTAILCMAFLANLLVLRAGPVNIRAAFAGLGITLVVAYAAMHAAQGANLPLARYVLPMALALPLFFAGLIFSSELARKGQVGGAMSANLFGAMCGGILEYSSLYWGFSSLTWLALALYGLAFISSELAARLRSSPAGAVTAWSPRPA